MMKDCCERSLGPAFHAGLPRVLVVALALVAGLVAGTSAAAASVVGQPQASGTSSAEATSRVAPSLGLAGALGGAPAVVAGSSGSAAVAGPVAGGGGDTALDAITTSSMHAALAVGVGRADKTPRAGSAVLGGAASRAPPRTAGT